MSVFFFQAEDGIRAVAVTGVQTCALPISSRSSSEARALDVATSTTTPFSASPARTYATCGAGHCRKTGEGQATSRREGGRSEERRVGKEGRSRWSADQ